MKNYILAYSLLLLCFYACNEDAAYKPKKSKGIPVALQERSVEVGSLKSKDTDLIEVLYKEILDKDPALQQIEKDIDALNTHKDDSLKSYALYDKNNTDYYRIYATHLNNIKDSALRLSMKRLLDSSTLQYKRKIAAQRTVFDSTNTLYNTLNDLHWALKLSKTLELMETYQNNNIPDTTTLKNTIYTLGNTIQITDSLAKPKTGNTPK